MKKAGFIIFSVMVVLMVFSGCEKSHKAETLTLPVLKDQDFGCVYIQITVEDFNAKGYRYGDSLDVKFSNGYEMKDVPYYTGFYTTRGNPLIVAYEGYPWLYADLRFSKLWDIAGLSEGDTVTIKLRESGKYAFTQKVFDMEYSNDRNDYATDEIFANFRAMDYSTLKKNLIYRSASPCDNMEGRAHFCDALCQKAGIQYALNLSDNIEKYQKHTEKEDFDSPYYDGLVQNNCVSFMHEKSDYMSNDYATRIVHGIVKMLESGTEGPIVIHCVEGKDRTGYVCALLAALSGASYDEMVKDYMITYDNYYGITVKQKKHYAHIRETYFDSFLDSIAEFVPGEKDKKIDKRNYSGIARAYFRFGGMTDEQIGSLEKFMEN